MRPASRRGITGLLAACSSADKSSSPSSASVANTAVDVWMADAVGDCSDTSTGLFLRGIQVSGSDGVADFTSIYPGWYPGRTNHVHVKVHVGGTAADTYTGGHVSHTGNLFFPEEISLAVANVHRNRRDGQLIEGSVSRRAGSTALL